MIQILKFVNIDVHFKLNIHPQIEANEAKASARESQKLLAKAKNEIIALENEGKEHEVEKQSWREKYLAVKSSLEDKVCSK